LFYFFFPTSVFILWKISVCRHISDCVETAFEWPLLSNETVNEIFLLKSGTMWSVDWIFIILAPAWRWLGEYVTLDRMFYSLLFKHKY
jgi:hypothetical protein